MKSIALAFLALSSCIVLKAAELRFEAQQIDGNIQIGYGLAVADVDGDGLIDVLLADKNQIVWYHNPDWKKHVIAEKLTPLDHVCLAARDLDGNGKAEVAVGAGWNPGDTVNSGSVHYLMPSSDGTPIWPSKALHHEPTVHRMRWVKFDEGFRLVVVPLHGRGNQNGSGEGVKILSYLPPKERGGEWKTELLNDSLHATHNFDPVQWDSDPAEELVVGAKEGIFLLDGKQKTQLAGNEGGGAGEVRVGKFKAGRFVAAVEPMHGNQLVVYREAAKAGVLWSREVLDASLVDGHALACARFDEGETDQIVVGWRAMNRPGVKVGIKIFSEIKADAGTVWKMTYLLDDNTMACEDLVVADLNKDGKLDVIAAGRATKNVKIYWNRL